MEPTLEVALHSPTAARPEPREASLAKGQMKSNKETKKPKKEKPKTIAAAPSVKIGTSADKKK